MRITNEFDKYKEASRNIWNLYFFKDGNATWEDQEIFSELEELLFEEIVLIKLGINRENMINGKFKLLAKNNHNCIPVMINRTGDGGYWDHPVDALIEDEHDIEFIEYFDFDQLAIKDNRYVIAKIISSRKHPEINGHKAMIESQYVDVFYIKSAQQDNAPEPASLAR